ncbi:hypothetical protein CDV55_104101 [Aspergillus turcosus]|uniref:Uncharacterized protein n=1 Tax=Aspergillus turcosus TaxID=1245748 RepID=A0A397GYP8_9EURO|nr:hypothetical protein CDV55_104101 [Aspergillus turcosus]RLL96277.1 hypothetical protein CFD26_105517 [Aspergillus turcosus]
MLPLRSSDPSMDFTAVFQPKNPALSQSMSPRSYHVNNAVGLGKVIMHEAHVRVGMAVREEDLPAEVKYPVLGNYLNLSPEHQGWPMSCRPRITDLHMGASTRLEERGHVFLSGKKPQLLLSQARLCVPNTGRIRYWPTHEVSQTQSHYEIDVSLGAHPYWVPLSAADKMRLALQYADDGDVEFWHSLPDQNLSPGELRRLAIEANLFSSYLTDMISGSKTPAFQAQEQSIRQLAEEYQGKDLAYHPKYSEIRELCNCDTMPANLGKWDQSFTNFVWVTSKLLGLSYGLLVGCAIKRWDFRLRLADQARLLSFLVRTKLLDGLTAAAKSRRFPVLTPAKRRAPGAPIVARTNFNNEIMPGQPAYMPPKVDSVCCLPFGRMRKAFRFLCALDHQSIPEIFLLRMQQPSKIWSATGMEKCVEMPHIDPVVADLTSGEVLHFVRVYEELGLLNAKVADFNRKAFTVCAEVWKAFESEPDGSDIGWVVVVAISHAFPGRWEETQRERIDSKLREAESIFETLYYEYKALTKRDWASRFEHLRVYLGRALVAYLMEDRLEEAKRRWEEVRDPARYCEEHGKITGFVEMLVQYSLCDIAARQGNMNEAHRHLRDAKARFTKIGREHWWTCMGTALLDLYAQTLDEHDLISGIDR